MNSPRAAEPARDAAYPVEWLRADERERITHGGAMPIGVCDDIDECAEITGTAFAPAPTFAPAAIVGPVFRRVLRYQSFRNIRRGLINVRTWTARTRGRATRTGRVRVRTRGSATRRACRSGTSSGGDEPGEPSPPSATRAPSLATWIGGAR